MDIIRPVCGVSQNRDVRARELLRLADGFQVPVGPVHVVVENSNGENMWHLHTGQNYATVVTFQVREGDVIEMRVGPVDLVSEVVDGQSVWPGNVVFPG